MDIYIYIYIYTYIYIYIYIYIKYHFIREIVNSGRVILEYCPTEEMVADLMTKPGTKFKLKRFSQDLFGT